MNIDCSFPGGNIVVERVTEDAAWVHQDLRDTEGNWFYWYFRVTQAQGKTVCFHFTESVAIGARGPAISLDAGKTWKWLRTETVDGNAFHFTFPDAANSVLFAMTIPYTGKHWEAFLNRVGDSPFLQNGTLCLTRQGRAVEQLSVGCLHATPEHRVLLVARHHCCETMASFVLEGLISFILEDISDGNWLRQNVEFLVIPFMDRDGVEAGDQGKQRKPHDHNRDYNEVSIYSETAALRDVITRQSDGRLHLAFDIHCPWLKGSNSNETVYLVGECNPSIWEQQQRFSAILQQVKTGALPFCEEDNIPFGTAWNAEAAFAKGKSFTRWISERNELALVSSIEVPYANARGIEVNETSARQFGADLGRAIATYLRRSK